MDMKERAELYPRKMTTLLGKIDFRCLFFFFFNSIPFNFSLV
uniref:Uncharacterized protein n=1 Tax=Nelumbo nucifera TaxID=4432 RepID=A0A822XER3_NELNU|nr:TPA_asm: hypothetical protein HUJ06_019596 [Nelumbo nucifera]